jgi:hypothetical protein
VNVETDVLSKYAAQQMAVSAVMEDSVEEPVEAGTKGPVTNWLTAEYLLENGY